VTRRVPNREIKTPETQALSHRERVARSAG
jgi:hypothetical protein